MEQNAPEIRIMAAINVLNGIAVSGEENLARLVTVMRELRAIASELHKVNENSETANEE